MSDHEITVNLPDSVFDPLQRIAEAREQSLEQVVIEQLRSVGSISLPDLPPDEESELIAFKFLSNDTLRNIMREQMARADQDRMQILMDRNNLGPIRDEEYAELSQLVERGQRLMLRKAWAAGVLIERGHKISAQDMTASDG
jgi:hypothetical protein